MSTQPRVTDVAHLGGRVVRVTFSDELVRELDLAPTLTGLLAALDDDAVFAQVSVDTITGTLAWPGGIDLDPDVLHGDRPSASGAPAIVIAEYRLEQTR